MEPTTFKVQPKFQPWFKFFKGGIASMTFFNISVNNGASRFYFYMYTHMTSNLQRRGGGGETENDGKKEKNTIYDRRKDHSLTFLLQYIYNT